MPKIGLALPHRVEAGQVVGVAELARQHAPGVLRLVEREHIGQHRHRLPRIRVTGRERGRLRLAAPLRQESLVPGEIRRGPGPGGQVRRRSRASHNHAADQQRVRTLLQSA